MLRSHDVLLCIHCDEIVVINHYIPLLTVQAWWAGELRQKMVTQFMCMPRVGGVVRRKLKPHNFVKENIPIAIEDPGPSSERMWLFVCPDCAEKGFPPYTRSERLDMIRRHQRIKNAPRAQAKWEDKDPPLQPPSAKGHKV
jgi:hypothetical protein